VTIFRSSSFCSVSLWCKFINACLEIARVQSFEKRTAVEIDNMSTFKDGEIHVQETVQDFDRKGFTRRDEADMAKLGKRQRFHVCILHLFFEKKNDNQLARKDADLRLYLLPADLRLHVHARVHDYDDVYVGSCVFVSNYAIHVN
jgi:hypothetical protein